MPEDMDPSKLNETDCPAEHSQTNFTCGECRRSFARPLLATISSGGQTHTYYACPRCMTKVNDVKSSKKEDVEPAISMAEPAKQPAEPNADVKCQHFFGYLNKRQKDTPFPEECLTCPQMVECLFH